MKRRKAIKRLGLGLSAGLLMPEFLSSCKKPDIGPEIRFDGTIAIIGAGAAGLYVADRLQSKGLKVIILEASGRLGGRIKSYRAPKETDTPSESFLFVPGNPSVADFPLELGAEVVYGSDSIWGKIIKDLSISTVDLSTATDRYILDNVAKKAVDLSGDVDFIAVENFVNALPDNVSTGTSISSAAAVAPRGEALLNAQAGNRYGSSSTQIDAGAKGADLKLAKTAHDDKSIVLSASLMQDVLASRFTKVSPAIKYNMPVQSIDYGGDQVVITAQDGTQFMVEKVVVTVPLTILKNEISFSPGLPASMTSSLAKFGMDDSIRVILDFKSNFWGDATTGFIWGATTTPQYFNAGVGRSEGYRTLTFTITGPKATALSALGTDMITQILAELDLIYDGAATKNIRRNLDDESVILYTIQDWSKEEFFKGGFSYPKVGATMNDRIAIGAPQHDKVFFAGEATDVSGDAGTINGALASAERASIEVVTSITG